MSSYVRVSNYRRALTELLRYSQRIPTVPVARRLQLGDLARARLERPHAPSWSAIFLRAYGLVCSRFSHLRRCWISWPRARLYEHPHSVAAVAVEREWQGEQMLFCALIRNPEQAPLEDIQLWLDRFKNAEVPTIKRYRQQLLFAKLPTLLQRLFLWLKLDLSGPRRVKYFGTFALTNYGMLGAESLHPLGPQTTVMTLGPLSPDGETTVKLVYDHRVTDGGYVARSLNYLEEVLHTTVLGELRSARSPAA